MKPKHWYSLYFEYFCSYRNVVVLNSLEAIKDGFIKQGDNFAAAYPGFRLLDYGIYHVGKHLYPHNFNNSFCYLTCFTVAQTNLNTVIKLVKLQLTKQLITHLRVMQPVMILGDWVLVVGMHESVWIKQIIVNSVSVHSALQENKISHSSSWTERRLLGGFQYCSSILIL